MTKKDKAYLAEGLNRLCADIRAIACLFEQSTEPQAPSSPDPESIPKPQPEESNEPPAEPPSPAKSITYESVRSVLAEKSRTGYRAEVKALLTAHGIRQLSEIEDPSIFAQLMQEAEGIGNG